MLRILILNFIFVSLAFSHGLKIFATDDGDNLQIKSYFSAKSPCKNCEVLLMLDNEILRSGRTNDKGEAALKLPEVAKFDIVVDASLGHKGRVLYETEGGGQMAESGEAESAKNVESQAESKLEAENSTLKFALGFLLIAVIFLSLYAIKRK
ncbi:MAG: hypothetical protein PUB96_04180 [Helicobacteraceae bacterium]|nr:hypothetical protein [Helicobacteraceae bacterium]